MMKHHRGFKWKKTLPPYFFSKLSGGGLSDRYSKIEKAPKIVIYNLALHFLREIKSSCFFNKKFNFRKFKIVNKICTFLVAKLIHDTNVRQSIRISATFRG